MSDCSWLILDVTAADGRVVEPVWLARAEAVHRQLRPQIPGDYAETLTRVFAGGGRLVVLANGETVLGVAVYRVYENTFQGPQLYCDDLVTDATQRSRGVGRALLAHLRTRARELGCAGFNLDSGTQRTRAHAFYFREGMQIDSFHFSERLA